MTKNKLQNPIFLMAIGILLLNDFYLKQAYGNAITGKLSDFAGLLAFPFFFSCFIPQWKKTIHIITAILFVWWKSSLSQPFIDSVNLLGIPIDRVIDYSDNIALISILFSYYLFAGKGNYNRLKPIYAWSIIFVSSFSFMATSLPPRTAIEFMSVNKEYEFNMTKEDFVSKLNDLQKKENKYGYFQEESGIFYSYQMDTLGYIIDVNKHKDSDTIKISNYFADFQIYLRDSNTTILKLINIATSIKQKKKNDADTIDILYHPYYDPFYFPDSLKYLSPRPLYYYGYPVRDFVINPDNNKWKENALKEFEKKVVKKIK